jgi:predicted tellurium resistance membrane protein TerC
MMDFAILLTWDGLFYLTILTLLEIVLGIDNIIFISIVTDRLPTDQQRFSRNLGLSLALILRLLLLGIVGWIMQMNDTLFTIWEIDFSGQSIVLLIGGLFLIYKSVTEMHDSVTGRDKTEQIGKVTLSRVITQIVFIDLVFSFDSIISAIGMTNGIAKDTGGNPMIIIYVAVIVSMIVMLLFAKQVSTFINARPTIKMIALGFLVTIGVVLVAEAFGQHVAKGYIYFAMVYALFVEFLNIRMRRNKKLKDQ